MTEGYRIAVTGGRGYTDRDWIYDTLDSIYERGKLARALAHGACSVDGGRQPIRWNTMRGADLYANLWAKMRGVPVEPFPANWTRYGNAAGPRRNRLMLDTFKPDVLIAFKGDRGTRDCCEAAQERRISILFSGWTPDFVTF